MNTLQKPVHKLILYYFFFIASSFFLQKYRYNRSFAERQPGHRNFGHAKGLNIKKYVNLKIIWLIILHGKNLGSLSCGIHNRNDWNNCNWNDMCLHCTNAVKITLWTVQTEKGIKYLKRCSKRTKKNSNQAFYSWVLFFIDSTDGLCDDRRVCCTRGSKIH